MSCGAPSPSWAPPTSNSASSSPPPRSLPETLSNEFRTLLDRVPPASSQLIRQTVREQLGADPATIFATFDEHPFASASIAQVHHATLKSGERVVVKIQRPKIRTRLAADVRIIGRLARLIVKTDLGRATNAIEVVEDFEQNLNEELDFAAEGHAMEQWIASLADTEYGDKVRVPKVFWEYTTERVLTMEYVQGIRIDNITELAAAGSDGVALVKAIVYSLFETGFHKGLFHGDLHAAICWWTPTAGLCSSTSASSGASTTAAARSSPRSWSICS